MSQKATKDILKKIEDRTAVKIECHYMENKEEPICLIIDFDEPICQKGLKRYLKVLDSLFSQSNIQIYSITSHF